MTTSHRKRARYVEHKAKSGPVEVIHPDSRIPCDDHAVYALAHAMGNMAAGHEHWDDR